MSGFLSVCNDKPFRRRHLIDRILGCPRWLLNICLAYYMFSPFINIVSARLSHLAKHVYHPYATMFRAFITMVR